MLLSDWLRPSDCTYHLGSSVQAFWVFDHVHAFGRAVQQDQPHTGLPPHQHVCPHVIVVKAGTDAFKVAILGIPTLRTAGKNYSH